METVTMNVKGMTCGGCVASVTRVLKAVPGVESVDVKLQPGQATVRYDASKVAVPALKDAIERAGYDVPA
jgi:copper ion binding protein